MTNDHTSSYARFPEQVSTVPENSLNIASAAMDQAMASPGKNRRQQNPPAVMAVHDVYETLKK